jgi:hypothetical protein
MNSQTSDNFFTVSDGDTKTIKKIIDTMDIGELTIEDLESLAEIISLAYQNSTYQSDGAKCLTLCVEYAYVDKYYRDMYYTYFSKQHYNYDRFCVRISLFDNQICNLGEFLSLNEIKFIGYVVIRPVYSQSIGHTILDPKYLRKKSGQVLYCRTSLFNALVFGRHFAVEAFPWRKQTEVQTCAEVSLINIFEYYSNQYKDYPQVLPSEIRDAESKDLHESAYPSRGINYTVYTKILCEKGFTARLYSPKAIENSGSVYYEENSLNAIKRLFHYYIESGIPVSVSLTPKNGIGSGHSIICIGHSSDKTDLVKADRTLNYKSDLAIINSADLYNEYLVTDDNQKSPYAICPFNSLTLHGDLSIQYLAVALYKNIGMDALQAQKTLYCILFDENFGIIRFTDKRIIDEHSDSQGKFEIVFRMFLASSSTFLRHKTDVIRDENSTQREREDAIYYAQTTMPKLVWVCQIYTNECYNNGHAFAEIILDPTSSNRLQKLYRKIIVLNYTERFCFRPYNDVNESTDELKNFDSSNEQLWLSDFGFEDNVRNIRNGSYEISELCFKNFMGNLSPIE